MYHIADLLIRIKNAVMAGKDEVIVINTNIAKNIADVLKKYGYIEDYKVFKENDLKYLKVTLNTENAKLEDLKIISKPGRRIYTTVNKLKNNKSGLGIYIVSTPKGVMSHVDAIKNKAGGELICKIW